ncbi:MAG TPA: hypothetical protein VMS55_24815 [Myxococcota bacterium]|nr:hypothetical protein [Myxococcota bacterium]
MLRLAGSTPTLRARTRAWCAVLPLACAWAASAGDLAPPLAQVDRRIDQIEAALAAAHFRSALALTRGAAVLLDPFAPAADGVASRRARLELLTATAEIARGRRTQARDHLASALRADPSLELSERDTSPRLLALLPDARQLAARAETTR